MIMGMFVAIRRRFVIHSAFIYLMWCCCNGGGGRGGGGGLDAERLRHHQSSSIVGADENDDDDSSLLFHHDGYVSELEEVAAAAAGGGGGLLTCPNCLYKFEREQIRSETDHLRLEAIKQQILSKLGMHRRPNITHSLPRDVILQTLSRVEDVNIDNSYYYSNQNSGGGGSSGGSTNSKNRNSAAKSDSSSTTNRKDSSYQKNGGGEGSGGGGDGFISSSSSSTSSGGGGGGGGGDSIMMMTNYDDFYGRTSEIISFAEHGSRVNHNRLLEFHLSSTDSGQYGQDFRIRSATLWIRADLRHRRSSQKCRTTELYIFKVISRLPDSITLTSKEFHGVTTDPISIRLEDVQSGWQKVNITSMVHKWLQTSTPTPTPTSTPTRPNLGRDPLRLFVDCSCCSHWHVHIFNAELANPDRPFLVIHTDPNTTKRVRRRALDCASTGTGTAANPTAPEANHQCCKQRFYVNFKQLGWDDWVIAPQGYYANYCRGDCGHHRTPDTYMTYHTHVIEEVRKTHHLTGMQPCCAPLKFSPMSLIYYGPDLTIIKRDLPKMVVDECGCP